MENPQITLTQEGWDKASAYANTEHVLGGRDYCGHCWVAEEIRKQLPA